MRRLAVGALSGAVGTAAMDVVLYLRYRSGGGKDSAWRWETAEGVDGWHAASAPGLLGAKVERIVVGRTPPDAWARTTTNVVHWATGVAWGLQYGAIAGTPPRHRLPLALALGPGVWLSGYAVLPLTGVYEPIWRYDARTLGRDLSAHMVYGAATSAVFAALVRRPAAKGPRP